MNSVVRAKTSYCYPLAFALIGAGGFGESPKGLSADSLGSSAIWVVESAMKKPSQAKKRSQAKEQGQALVITVSGDRHIHDVARDLKASGLESAEVLDAIGVVTGSAAPKSIAKLKKVPGVQDVSEDHPVDIGPPGAPIS
jgi:hypothetical protein